MYYFRIAALLDLFAFNLNKKTRFRQRGKAQDASIV